MSLFATVFKSKSRLDYRVTLTQYQRNEFAALLSGGKQAARKLKRAQILLAADETMTADPLA